MHPYSGNGVSEWSDFDFVDEEVGFPGAADERRSVGHAITPTSGNGEGRETTVRIAEVEETTAPRGGRGWG